MSYRIQKGTLLVKHTFYYKYTLRVILSMVAIRLFPVCLVCMCARVRVCVCPDLRGSVVEGDKSRGGVGQDVEVGGWGRSHGERAALRVHLVVHQTPLLQERMHPRVGGRHRTERDEYNEQQGKYSGPNVTSTSALHVL